jgi:Ca-activated chloride channel family protein
VHGQLPPFRSGTVLVPILATVTDDDDRLVPGLTVENFEVFDSHRPQTIALFENDAKPITIVVMLDTSASMTAVLDQVTAAAEQFVIRLLPHDRARLCVFNDSVVLGPEFTSDRDALARAVRQVDFGNGSRLYDALATSLDALKPVDGRKIVVVFSDGEDTASRVGRRAVTNRARAEDVMVYAVGYESQVLDDDDQVVRTRPEPALRTLAAETGGGYFEVERSKDLSSTFTRVLRELHSQYLLAITPPLFDGRVHKLDVRVNHTEARVRTRRSYQAPARSSHGF